MLDRRIAYLGVALVLIVGALIATRWRRATQPVRGAAGDVDASADEAPAPKPLRAPPFEEVELGVLAGVPPPDREAIALRIVPPLCADEGACAAVRATVGDTRATTLEEKPASSWIAAMPDAGLAGRSDAGGMRDGSVAEPIGILIRIRSPSSPRRLALRTAVAVAAVLVAHGGTVIDPLLGRSEDARAFAARAAMAEPLGAPMFRPDWIRVITSTAAEGVDRLRTVGLGRWGAPDVELAALPESAHDAGSQLLLAVAAALANGSPESPVTLSTRSGASLDAGQEDAGEHVDVALVSVTPPPGEPGDFLARIEPPGGEGPVASLELVERIVGPVAAAPPEESTVRARASTAQRELTRLFEAPSRDLAAGASNDGGAGGIWVRLPFAIPGGGTESLWVRVTGHDASTITGRIDDDPLAATDVARGDAVTRPRSDVLAVRSR